MVRSSVVFPAPLAPSTAVIVPAAASTDTPCRTGAPPSPATMSSAARLAALLIAVVLRRVLSAKVGSGDGRVRLHLRRCACRDHLAEVKHEDRVADRHHLVHPGLDRQQAGAFGQSGHWLAKLRQLVL